MAKNAQTVASEPQTAQVDPDTVDQAAAAADMMVQQDTGIEASEAGPFSPDTVTAGTGTRVTRAFTPKMLIPSQDWINTNVVSQGKGAHKIVGRVYGVIYKAERRNNEWQGKAIESIALKGMVQAEKADTGEVMTATVLFLPLTFAEQVAMALWNGAKEVQLDVDIGLEATGKTIAYEWTITSYLEGRAERALRKIGGQRKIGQAPAAVGQPLRLN